MKKVVLMLSIVAVTLATSCKKSDSNCTLDATSILGSYKVTAYTYQATASSQVIDDYATFSTCRKDDIITFKSNGTYTYSEGVTSCTPPTSDFTNTWSLNGSILTLAGTAGNTTFNCTTLVIKSIGTTDIETITLTKQ